MKKILILAAVIVAALIAVRQLRKAAHEKYVQRVKATKYADFSQPNQIGPGYSPICRIDSKGNVFVLAHHISQFETAEDIFDDVLITYSTGDGKTWEKKGGIKSRITYSAWGKGFHIGKDDRLCAVWSAQNYIGTPRTHKAIIFSKSGDGGLTWSEPIEISTERSGQRSRPDITSGSGGNLYAVWQDGIRKGRPVPESSERQKTPDIHFAKSTDAGATWNKQQCIEVMEEEKDGSRSPEIYALTDGRLLATYQSSKKHRSPSGRRLQLKGFWFAAGSHDKGASWEEAAPYRYGLFGSTELIEDGEFLDVIAVGTTGIRSLSLSSPKLLQHIYFLQYDGKKNKWARPVRIDDATGGVHRYDPCIFKRDGLLLALWSQDASVEKKRDIYFSASPDGGKTWSRETKVNPEGFSIDYEFGAALKDDRLIIVFCSGYKLYSIEGVIPEPAGD